MAETKNYFNPALNNIHFAFSVDTGEFLFMDREMLDTLKMEQEAVTPDFILSRIHPDDLLMLQRTYEQILMGEFRGNVKFKLLNPDGEQWISITPFYGDTADGKIIYGNLCDITAEVNNMNAIAKYANKKNSVLHMLAHDLRGPLAIAKSLISIVDQETSDPGILKKTRYVSVIIQESINLITDLVSREFLETVEAALFKNRVNIVEKLKEYLEECGLSSNMAERIFELSSSKEEIYIELDEAKFMQVVNNLVSNALKFTHPGATITLKIEELEQEVLLVFSDNGIGIPDHMQKEIFEKFTNARRPGLNGEPTVGLGLSIVKTIIDWHNGEIWCESKENEGTSFYIKLPKLAAD